MALLGSASLGYAASPHSAGVPPHLAPYSNPLGVSQLEKRVFWSVALHRAMPYLIYLPPGYDANPQTRYPVLYLLHGRNASYRMWYDLGFHTTADRMILAGEIQPFIIVMPEGENGYWVNHANNGPQWGDYIGRDLIYEIDSHFRTKADRAGRAIGGISMGGCGALQLGMNFSDVFGIVGAHSPALRTHETAPSYFGDLAYFNAHSPVPLFKAKAKVAGALKLFIDMGEQDGWHGPALAFHRQLVEQGIAHEWKSRPGGHTGAYWSGHLSEYLGYYDRAFKTPVALVPTKSYYLDRVRDRTISRLARYE